MRVSSLAEQPELVTEVARFHHEGWPPFMRASRSVNPAWRDLQERFPECQLFLLDEHGGAMALGHLAPLRWDGAPETLPAGWDAALRESVALAPGAATAMVGLAVLVRVEFQRRGLSSEMLRAMTECARRQGLPELIVPVRPTLKSRYPLTPMERYVQWQRADGAPFDPWLRTHWRLGAELLRVAPASQIMEGRVEEWERWAGLALPESGAYVVSGALSPVQVDRERDYVRYEEPNVWVRHRVAL